MAGAFGLGAVLLLPVLGARPAPAARRARRRGADRLPRHRPDRASPTCSSPAACALLSAAETATLTLAEPLTAALLGVIVLSERLSAPAALGGALILGGLLVLAAPDIRRRPATVPA